METTPVPLNTLLRLTFSEPVAWLSDESQAQAPISWVVLSLEEGGSGDLLVLKAAGLKRQQVDWAVEKGISAVVLVGQLKKKILFPQDLPVVEVETAGTLREVQRRMTQTLIDQNAAMMERMYQIHTQLTQLAAEDTRIEGLARAMESISGRGILIQDKRLEIIAGAPSSDLAPLWKVLTEQLTTPGFLPEPLSDRKLAGQQNACIHQSLPGGIARFITPITVGMVARGYLSVIGPDGTLDRLDQIVASTGASVCGVEMARQKAVRETEKRLHSDLLTALMHGVLTPRDAGLWVQEMGLDLSMAHVTLQFTWDATQPPSRRRLETIVNGEISHAGIKAFLNPVEEKVICICQVSPDDRVPHVALELGRSVLLQAQSEYPEAGIRCGIGTPAMGLDRWNVSFKEAGHALDLACRLGENKPLYFPDLSIYRLLMLLEHHPELTAFREDTLGSLLGDTSYEPLIETLEAYFNHNGNLSQTAESLFIHRNTLAYRLERINQLTGLDLDNPDTALAVQLALKIHRMMKSRDQGRTPGAV